MEFKLQEMKLEELDKLVELANREKKRRIKEKMAKYVNEINDLLKRMKDEGLDIHYLSDYGDETVDECWMEIDHIRVR